MTSAHSDPLGKGRAFDRGLAVLASVHAGLLVIIIGACPFQWVHRYGCKTWHCAAPTFQETLRGIDLFGSWFKEGFGYVAFVIVAPFVAAALLTWAERMTRPWLKVLIVWTGTVTFLFSTWIFGLVVLLCIFCEHRPTMLGHAVLGSALATALVYLGYACHRTWRVVDGARARPPIL